MGIKGLALKAGRGCLRAAYAPVKLNKAVNRVTFISRQSREPSDDIRMLSEYIRKHHPEVDCRVMVRFIEEDTADRAKYVAHMFAQMKAIAKSKVVVLDGYCITASVLEHKRETTIVQMWHSMAAIKKFGRQTVGLPGGSSRETAEAMCMHRNYDYVICPAQKTGKFFCEAFGCTEDKLREYALPRTDYIRNMDSEETCRIKKAYKLEEEQRQIILYAPTFRKNTGLEIRELLQKLDYGHFLLVVKPHPLDTEDISCLAEEMNLAGNVIIDSRFGTYDWLKICDMVITDYSAVAVESLPLHKPLYFYLYDIEEYEKNVGLNVNPLREMPGASAVSADDLVAKLKGEYDWKEWETFRGNYLTANTENCTAQLAEFIIGVMNGNA